MKARALLLLSLALAGDPPAPAPAPPPPAPPAARPCGCSDLCTCGCQSGRACPCHTGAGTYPQRVEVWPATAQPTPAPVIHTFREAVNPVQVQTPAPLYYAPAPVAWPPPTFAPARSAGGC